jgi:NADH dehydrogenase (ubiquinone) 1 beta subcomplex subunit 7
MSFPEPLTHEEHKKHRIPLEYRDRCASLLVPLKKCRQEKLYMPWSCQDERHSYEKCQYEDFKRRVKEMEALKAANS